MHLQIYLSVECRYLLHTASRRRSTVSMHEARLPHSGELIDLPRFAWKSARALACSCSFETDFDECSDSFGTYCSWECINTDGGFNCTCPDDFTLDAQAQTCRRKGSLRTDALLTTIAGCRHRYVENDPSGLVERRTASLSRRNSGQSVHSEAVQHDFDCRGA